MNNKKQRTHAQLFMAEIQKLTSSRSPWEVFADFVTMAACAISNVMDKQNFAAREQLYMDTIKPYKKSEHEVFSNLLAIVTTALSENPDQDFLGEIYEVHLNLGNFRKGQFFTPYSIGKPLASIQAGDAAAEIAESGFTSVNDCCCGAGCLLIAYANTLKDIGVNYTKDVLFVAQDVDPVLAKTCYIQLSLLGCSGYVVVGNSLSAEQPSDEDIWRMPMFFQPVWAQRLGTKEYEGEITHG